MNLPKYPSKGDAITADWARSVVDCLRSLRITSGVGIQVEQTANGTTLAAHAVSRGGSDVKLPLTAVLAGAANQNILIKIVPGTVHEIVPTIDGDPITDEDAELAVNASGTVYVALHLEFDDEYDSEPSSVEVEASGSLLDFAGDEENAYIQLAQIVDGKISNFLSASLDCHFCSPDLLVWRV